MTRKSAFFWLIYVSVLFLAITTQRIERIKTGFTLAQRNAEITEKQARNDYLALELSGLKSPQQLLTEAEKRLNLNIPEPERIIILQDIETTTNRPKTLIARLFSH
jgi:hypothetical protein